MYIISFSSIIFILFINTKASISNIHSWINPGCLEDVCQESNQNESAINLIYSRISNRESRNNTLHTFWSTFGDGKGYTGAPAFFMIETEPKAEISFNWTYLLEPNESAANSVKLEDDAKPINSIGVLINRIFFWNDTDKSGELKNKSKILEILDWNEFLWDNLNKTDNGTVFIKFKLKPDCKIFNGTMQINLQLAPNKTRYHDLPHLCINDNLMHVQFILDDIKQTVKNARLAMEMIILTQSNEEEIKRKKNVDDEYSPGVFQTFDFMFNNTKSINASSFIEWKPVAYSSSMRIIAKTLDIVDNKVRRHKMSDAMEKLKRNKVVYGFYTGIKDSIQVHMLNFTFGTKGEKFYQDTNYLTWSFTVGIGSLPKYSLSRTLFIIILVGFGLPVIAMFASIIYFIVIRFQRSRNSKHEELIEEDNNE